MPHDITPANKKRLSSRWITIGPPESPVNKWNFIAVIFNIHHIRYGTFTRIVAAFPPTGTYEDVRYMFDIASISIH